MKNFIVRKILFTAILLLFATAVVHAQPLLNFDRLTVNWPRIELYCTIACDGKPVYNVTNDNFRIFENNVEVEAFTLWCPDPTAQYAISVALVCDVSGSMGYGNPTPLSGLKAAGHAFVDMMDGYTDEATLIMFNTSVTVYQKMTTNKEALHEAVDALFSAGGTAVWDGAYAGLVELLNDGVNQSRAVIVMTDGHDAASVRTPQEVINLANRHNIRVFTVGVPNPSLSRIEMELIALLTGGKFYVASNPLELTAIYQEIMTVMRQMFQECVITYQRDCADGSIRTVELQIDDVCEGTDVRTRTYRAPLDSTSFSNLHMEIAGGSGTGDSDVTVPLQLLTPLNGEVFGELSFTLMFDTSRIQLNSVRTPHGSLLDGVPLSFAPVSTGAFVQIMETRAIHGSGMLMEFSFSARSLHDTVCCVISAEHAVFESGCFIPVVDAGEICIFPGMPVVNCTMSGPVELLWDNTTRKYTPNPFPVMARFYNSGNARALEGRYTITYDPDEVQLAAPMTDVQTATPIDLASGAFHEITWQLVAKLQPSTVSTRICITASYGNHEEVQCCIEVEIPSVDLPILSTRPVFPNKLSFDENLGAYVPNPFTVHLTTVNKGNTQAEDVAGRIILPKGMELDPPTQSDWQMYTPSTMPKYVAGQPIPALEWTVRWTERYRYDVTPDIHFAVTGNDFMGMALDSVYVVDSMFIPGVLPDFDCTIEMPDSLVSNTEGNDVEPNPFTVRFTVTNISHQVGEIRRLIISFSPEDMELDATSLNPRDQIMNLTVAPKESESFEWSMRVRNSTTRRNVFIEVAAYDDEGLPFICGRVLPISSVTELPGTTFSFELAANGPLTFCEGDSVVLDAGPGYDSYKWSDGSSEQWQTVTTAGEYYCEVRTTDNRIGYSDTVTVVTLPVPDKPDVRRDGDMLSTGMAAEWHWYRNGVPIPGATAQSLQLQVTGVYQVRVSNEHGCSILSDEFDVLVLDAATISIPASSPQLTAYPDPADDVLYVGVNAIPGGYVRLLLSDMLGRTRTIYEGHLDGAAASFTVPLGDVARGPLFVLAFYNNTVMLRKVMRL